MQDSHVFSTMDFLVYESGKLQQNVSNIVIAIMNKKYCFNYGIIDGYFYFDVFAQEMKYKGKLIREDNTLIDKVRIWDDNLNNQLGIEIEREFGLYYHAKKMWEAVKFVASQNLLNPIQDYLNELQWDGNKDAIYQLLPTYLGAEDNELNRWIMEHMLLGMVKRIFEPACKFDEVMVLVGGQGIGKSTFVQQLALFDNLYCSLTSIEGKDAVINLIGKSVVEIEEFSALKKAKTTNEVKSFLSKLSDRVRLPYDKISKDVPRTCIFIATINDQYFLNDNTGERRYLPVQCNENKIVKSIYYSSHVSQISEQEYYQSIQYDFKQAIALAVHLYKNKRFDMNIPSFLKTKLIKVQSQFKEHNIDIENLRYFLETEKLHSSNPNITCYKEFIMAGYDMTVKLFNALMKDYFSQWKHIKSLKTQRIQLNGTPVPVKSYYQKT